MNNVLILGASQAKYFYKLLKSNTVSVHSHSGDRIEDICEEALESVADFSTVVLQYGTNNVPRETPLVTANKFEETIKKMRQVNPQINILISGVLPRCENRFLNGRHQERSLGRADYLNGKALVLNGHLHEISLR